MTVLPPSRVLIVGASGYLAGFVVDRLHHAGYRLRGFDRALPPTNRPLDEFVEGDITHFDDVQRATVGQDAVIQLAALVRGRREQPLDRFIDVMVKGTWHVIDAAAQLGVKRVVNVSSIVAIGFTPSTERPLTEADRGRLGGADLFYQLSKYLGEEIGNTYSQSFPTEIVHLRPGVIAGDGVNPGPRVPEVARGYWFNYVDPRDVAQAVEGALRAERLGQSSYFVVADHPEAAFDLSAAKRDLGYAPQYNWPTLRSTHQ